MNHKEEEQLNEALDQLTKAYLEIAHLKIRCEGYDRENTRLYQRIAELEGKTF
jgi:hypothetical protein